MSDARAAKGSLPTRLGIEDYALLGDCQGAALVGNDGSIDWLCLPAFDSGACMAALLGDPNNGRWLLAPAGQVTAVRRRYRDGTMVLETDYETGEGAVTVIDLMPMRSAVPDLLRIVVGKRGVVPMHMELVVRFDYGSIVPWVRRLEGGTEFIAGPDRLVLTTPIATHGENLHTVADFVVSEGQRIPFLLTWTPSYAPSIAPLDPEVALEQTTADWHAMVRTLQFSRAARGAGQTIVADPQGADLCSDRRDRRGGHHFVARTSGWRAQLGLPILLDQRRHLDPVCADERRLPGRGAGLAGLVAPCGRG